MGEVLPLLRRRAADHPAAARQVHDRPRGRRAARRREHDRRRRRARTTFTGHADDIVGINDLLVRLRDERGLDVPLHVDGASGGFVWPFLYPDSRGTSGSSRCARSTCRATSTASSTRASAGWSSARRPTSPRTSSSTRTTSARRDATFTLNFSTGSAMVLAQYYNFVRYGHEGYRYIMETMQANAQRAGQADRRHRRLRARRRRRRRAAAARRVQARRGAQLRRVRRRRRSSPPSAAGWCRRTRCRRTPST